jgi:hypothetical protein
MLLAIIDPRQEGTFSMRSCHTLDRLDVTFDDDHAVADAGLVLPATLAQHLGLRELFSHRVTLHGVGAANVGDKAMTLIHSALRDGDCIDDADALRAGDTAAVLGHTVLAPSTLGTFLRCFTWGHVSQLDAVAAEVLARAWQAGAGPGAEAVTIDVDSTICETYGLAKQGGVFGFTGVRGYHPLIAAVAGTGEVVHSRLRGGNAHTARGAKQFLAETFNRVRAAAATGPLTLRADSGFYSHHVTDVCGRHNVRFSITAKLSKKMRGLISAIAESDWQPIPYFLDNGADVAETVYRPFTNINGKQPTFRLIVRRVRPKPGSQLALFTVYDYHAFITDRDGDTIALEADHRRHAEIENTIRDLKYGVGLNHLPSGRFAANAAWFTLNIIAHNLSRWTSRIGLGENIVCHKTLRRRYLTTPGRITHSARQSTLHLPTQWPWRTGFLAALTNLRTVVLIT